MIEQEVIDRIKRQGIFEILEKEIRHRTALIGDKASEVAHSDRHINDDQFRKDVARAIKMIRSYCNWIDQFLDEVEKV